MVLAGLLPLTPLVWLLVLARVGWPPWLAGVRLAFWQTELIGLAVACLGLWIAMGGGGGRLRR